MKHIHCIILFFSYIYAINISPYIYLTYNNDSDFYRETKTSVSSIRLGNIISYQKDQLIFDADISYNLFNGNYELPYDFNMYQGFGKIENNPGLSENQFNYFESTISISYHMDNLNLYANLSSPQWGTGVSKIIISGKAPPFFNMGYTWKITDRIVYEHMYGKLISLISDESLNILYDLDYRSAEYNRNIMGHKLKYKFSNRVNFYLYEIVVYGGYRDLEPYYLLPLVPFLPIQTYLGDIDNDLLSGGFEYQIKEKSSIYFNLMIDEWTPTYTFKKNHKNWFVYQIGAKKESIFLKYDMLRCEYVWSDHRVYRHRFSINDYYSYDYPMGFWGGPHAEYIFIDYSFNLGNLNFTLLYSNAKRGALTEDMLENQYGDNNYFERYSTGFERKIINGINLSFEKLKNINFDFGINYIKWINPSFILDEISENLDNQSISKTDYYIKIEYHLKKK